MWATNPNAKFTRTNSDSSTEPWKSRKRMKFKTLSNDWRTKTFSTRFPKTHHTCSVRGIVKNITDYGAFIDLGGVDGLLHITDISWGRIKHPSDVLKVGSEVNVRVLKFAQEKERVSLGMKQTLPDPWANVSDRFFVQ